MAGLESTIDIICPDGIVQVLAGPFLLNTKFKESDIRGIVTDSVMSTVNLVVGQLAVATADMLDVVSAYGLAKHWEMTDIISTIRSELISRPTELSLAVLRAEQAMEYSSAVRTFMRQHVEVGGSLVATLTREFQRMLHVIQTVHQLICYPYTTCYRDLDRAIVLLREIQDRQSRYGTLTRHRIHDRDREALVLAMYREFRGMFDMVSAACEKLRGDRTTKDHKDALDLLEGMHGMRHGYSRIASPCTPNSATPVFQFPASRK